MPVFWKEEELRGLAALTVTLRSWLLASASRIAWSRRQVHAVAARRGGDACCAAALAGLRR